MILGYAVIDYPARLAATYKKRHNADALAKRLQTAYGWMNEQITVIEITDDMLNGSGIETNAAWMMKNGHWGVQPSWQGC
jgi:hypothetical protein